MEYRIKDIALFEWGRKEIHIAEKEMPGLMALREKFGKEKPLKGARITGSLHMTLQTAVLIETLKILGADVRWSSCNLLNRDHATATVVAGKALKNPEFLFCRKESLAYWELLDNSLSFPGGKGPNLIVDDGGDATLIAIWGAGGERPAILERKAGFR